MGLSNVGFEILASTSVRITLDEVTNRVVVLAGLINRLAATTLGSRPRTNSYVSHSGAQLAFQDGNRGLPAAESQACGMARYLHSVCPLGLMIRA